MSDMFRFVALKTCMSKTLDHIEIVFDATKHNFSQFQCEKMVEALIEARSILANMDISDTQTPEAFLAFGQKVHSLFEQLKQY